MRAAEVRRFALAVPYPAWLSSIVAPACDEDVGMVCAGFVAAIGCGLAWQTGLCADVNGSGNMFGPKTRILFDVPRPALFDEEA